MITPQELMERSAAENAKLTPQESLAVRQMLADLNVAAIAHRQRELNISGFVAQLRKDRKLPNDYVLNEELNALVKQVEESQVQVAQPGDVKKVAAAADATAKLKGVGA
jgi:hypothetical protein